MMFRIYGAGIFLTLVTLLMVVGVSWEALRVPSFAGLALTTTISAHAIVYQARDERRGGKERRRLR